MQYEAYVIDRVTKESKTLTYYAKNTDEVRSKINDKHPTVDVRYIYPTKLG